MPKPAKKKSFTFTVDGKTETHKGATEAEARAAMKKTLKRGAPKKKRKKATRIRKGSLRGTTIE